MIFVVVVVVFFFFFIFRVDFIIIFVAVVADHINNIEAMMKTQEYSYYVFTIPYYACLDSI